MRRPPAIVAAVIALGVAATGAAGCAIGGDTTAPRPATTSTAPGLADRLAAGEWVLDAGESSIDVGADMTATLNVEGGSVSGLGPCNSFRGAISVDGADVDISELAQTAMACDEALTTAQDDYLEALGAVRTGAVDDSRLSLTGNDDLRLEFTAVDREEALVGTWAITAVATDDAVRSVLASTRSTLELTDDANLAMDGGCNTISATWAVEGERFDVGPIVTTRMTCSEPDGVMQQESALVAALQAAKRVAVTADTLTLLDTRGHILLTAAS